MLSDACCFGVIFSEHVPLVAPQLSQGPGHPLHKRGTSAAALCGAQQPGPIQAPMRYAHPIRRSFVLSMRGRLKTGQGPDLTQPALKKIGARPEYAWTWHSALTHPATHPNLCPFIKKNSPKNEISPGSNFFLNRSTPIGTTGTKPHV